ncbi:DUF2000 domain-containing protein [Sediminispirochaeta smaragdinae]|jgi:hypothetical protein|uniref:DUF2000 domain-containing protein n=1 Tax=Sediminispirochaeta smaragdinae (strain DSM 11293 / JCM 15392 / SEBR 4228) TaxID=573413 RepID=E1R8E3_SEDSS|nr:DUF2000 domain-containing protein [Sediminispirochaeta smaragdinae]ADK79287.1 Protein of unknown function DUF2000 [Sediminispirochaeta smaragdinae DSM 11293]
MKAAIIVDTALPLGLIANSAAVLGASLGALHPEIIGEDLADLSGRRHAGITGLPIPILGADKERLRKLVDSAEHDDDIDFIAFNDVAQRCKSYKEYSELLATVPSDTLRYLALLVVGKKQAVNRLTGSLPLAK